MEQGIWVHDLDPVAFSLGPLDIRWYALSYIVGLVGGWYWGMRLAQLSPQPITREHLDRFLNWVVVGVIVGGRLGQVLFYAPGYYFANPAEIFMVWHGGMAFHGGMLGVLVAMILFTRRHKIPLLALTDIICVVAPLGLMLGRIANFINGEHGGRVTDVAWAVAFPSSGDLLPRHPSQLYESALEGAMLLLIMVILVYRFRALARPGLTSGVFLLGYAIARMISELFREPEVLTATLPFGTTWGQWLSLPMLLGGAYLVGRALRRAPT